MMTLAQLWRSGPKSPNSPADGPRAQTTEGIIVRAIIGLELVVGNFALVIWMRRDD